MTRTYPRAIAAGVFVFALAPAMRVNAAAPVVQAAGQISAADAAPYLGEWTLTLQGPNGPGTFTVSLSTEKDKVVGEIASATLPKQPFTTMSLAANKSLDLAYSFPYDGNNVDAVVSLTPDKDGKMAAQIDFAGGAYVMTGTATKKEKEK